MRFDDQKLLIANRGEIALRILRTARKLGLHTISIYSPADATAPHASVADQSVPLRESLSYLDVDEVVLAAVKSGATLVHPGYGFLSENAELARKLDEHGITFLGPSAEVIHKMGLKHEARTMAKEAGVPVVPGTEGLVTYVRDAVKAADLIGWPVMLKSTAGGGGMGLVVCNDAKQLEDKFEATKGRAKSLFKNDGLFLERYIPSARHIEVQVFGDGHGHAIHMGERECSVQRRHQKVLEESPSSFMDKHPDVRQKMYDAAVKLCQLIKYGSAGTVEFIVDDSTAEFFFLEMNTRLQVEHPITEAVHPGLDLVELMIKQGIAERAGVHLAPDLMDQSRYGSNTAQLHAIEARVYCENPAANFKPSPGVLQLVEFPKEDWLRLENWVGTGTTVTPFYDPLACKLIVTGTSRSEAVSRLKQALSETKILGSPNNVSYLDAVCSSKTFQHGNAMTTFLEHFKFTPRAMDVIAGGVETTVQDLPGRLTGLGMPRSGPMDPMAFMAANALVSNDVNAEALEVTLTGCKLYFHASTVVAVCGPPVSLTINGEPEKIWTKVVVPAGGRLVVGTLKEKGMRVYVGVRGGFPGIPKYLESKSTSMGLGGYQGRSLTAGDHIELGDCAPKDDELGAAPIPSSLIPDYPDAWEILCLAGPHGDEDFVTPAGVEAFYSTNWKVSASSNRMGIRLEGPKLQWARPNGGEGGSHPSNIHDNGYALGSINVNGDTPVILTNEGPDMGGYVCFCTVATSERWKLGQLRLGCTIRFRRISFEKASGLTRLQHDWISAVQDHVRTGQSTWPVRGADEPESEVSSHPKLLILEPSLSNPRPRVVFRQAGDSAVLVEYGPMLLDFAMRVRVHALEGGVLRRQVNGIRGFAPCIRSTMVHYDPLEISQDNVLSILVEVEKSLPNTLESMEFPGRRITLPIVLDDRWNREALERYMRSIRDKAVYLPSNVEYLAKNNGLDGGEAEALKLLVQSDFLVFGVGFYLACPFLIPIDPRCRLVAQKMNPSRTYTPRGAIGIAGLVAAIYPVESPGGYQLYGRTLPAWQTWGKGPDFQPDRPWLLNAFDQVRFEPVSETEYLDILRDFDAGRYKIKIEEATFSMARYTAFVDSIADEVAVYKHKQSAAVAKQEAIEAELLAQWEAEKAKIAQDNGPNAVDTTAGDAEGGASVTSSMSASIWKIRCEVGDVVQSAEDVLVILEAMKTEINVEAGEENVGRRVKAFGRGIREGTSVNAGDVLVVFE